MQNRQYRRDKLCGQCGFTIIELMISMAISMILIGALTSTSVSQRKTYDTQQQLTEATQMARAAMAMMHGEIRLAGYNPTGADFDGITYDTDQLEIKADMYHTDDTGDPDGDTDDSNEQIVYKYFDNDSSYPYEIKRKTGSGYFQPFAENVQDFTFALLDGNENDNAAASSADIRKVRITITVRTAKPDPDYPSNNGYRTISLTSYTTPRNLIY